MTLGAADRALLLRSGLAIFALAVCVGVFRFGWRYPIIGVSRRLERELRDRFYRHLQTLSPSYFDRTKIGDLMAHATNDLEAIRMSVGFGTVAGLDAIILLVASLGLMLSLNWQLTLVVLAPMPLVSFLIMKIGRQLHARFRQVQAAFSTLSDRAQEAYSGLAVVKSYVQEEAEAERFRALNQDYLVKALRDVRMWGLMHVSITLIAGFCLSLILFVGGRKVIFGDMSMGDFVAFNSYLGTLMWPMIAFGWVTNLYQRGRASLDRLSKIFELRPEIADPEDPLPVDRLEGAIEVRGLRFAYPGGPAVLEDVSLRIEAGRTAAFIGRTGSGKSTLLRLLPRLYDVPPGTIFIDGHDITRLRLDTLRSAIAYVPQDSFLFSDSLLENIRLGRPEASREEVEQAARQAELWRDVQEFPDGLDTVVGERGLTLSGGQRQRVALARALILHAPILVLDDAFSAVDTETEARIIRNLRNARAARTLLLVSHRISTVRFADQIHVLDQGRIVESGTHDELIALGGHYAQLAERQRLIEELDEALEPEPTE